jgi:AcrR family transcriptional regulator
MEAPMTDIQVPDPINTTDGLPVTYSNTALETNSYIVWLHLRYTEVDDARSARTACNGFEGHVWNGSLSFLMKRLWPALASGSEGAEAASRRISRYLNGTNNAVCLDRGRMDPASKRRKTHRLPEWFVADAWQELNVSYTEDSPGGEHFPEPPDEFATEPDRTEDEQDPFTVAPESDGVGPDEPEAQEEPRHALPMLSEGETDNTELTCRVGCDRVFVRAYGRIRHERSHQAVDAILAACTELLVEKEGDTEGISANMIAERAGVNTMTVHNHFQTKIGALRAAARLRGAPFVEVAEKVPAGPLELSLAQWDRACDQIMDLAAFALHNGTPMSYEMLSVLPWELNPIQRREVLDALLRSRFLTAQVVPDENGLAAKVLVPNDPDRSAAFTTPPMVEVDPVAVLQDLLDRYAELVHRDQDAA